MRDRHPRFAAKNLRVYGIAVGSAADHAKFRAELALPFPLLVDADGRLAEAYGIRKSFIGMTLAGRSLFLVGADGVLRFADPDFKLTAEEWKALDAAVAALPAPKPRPPPAPASAPRAAG